MIESNGSQIESPIMNDPPPLSIQMDSYAYYFA